MMRPTTSATMTTPAGPARWFGTTMAPGWTRPPGSEQETEVRKLLTLAWRQWRRDSRTGELRVLAAALVLAVASVGTVGLFADRVKAGLSAQANVLLGADLMITADRPLPPTYAEEAKKRGLAV